MRMAITSAAVGRPSRPTIARACSRPLGLAAMFAITARRASELDTPQRDPPPGSPPGILHRVIHQGAVNTTTNENGDDHTSAAVGVSMVIVLPLMRVTVTMNATVL